jgi:hypothetical protein
MAIEIRMAANVDTGTLPHVCNLCKRTALYVVLQDANAEEYLC